MMLSEVKKLRAECVKKDILRDLSRSLMREMIHERNCRASTIGIERFSSDYEVSEKVAEIAKAIREKLAKNKQ